MVSAHISHASEYFNLSPGIRLALEYLRSADLGALAAGRHAVDGDAVFALVSDYDTRPSNELFWEAHRHHVDVQYVHAGRERIGVGDLDGFTAESYDAERDLAVVRGGEGQFVECGQGRFVVLFPHDAHMPGVTAGKVDRVRKIVMKVRL